MKCLFKRLCSTDSPTRNICTHFIYLYITENILIPGSLIERIVRSGASPLLLLNELYNHHNVPNDGRVDALRASLLCENYVKPWSNEYYLVKLLTRTFFVIYFYAMIICTDFTIILIMCTYFIYLCVTCIICIVCIASPLCGG